MQKKLTQKQLFFCIAVEKSVVSTWVIMQHDQMQKKLLPPPGANTCKSHHNLKVTHKILNRQKFDLLPTYVLAAFMDLSLTEMTVAAGHRTPVGMITVGTVT
jgi:hypothetical protein